jgi:hypothetical protein
MGQLLHLPPPRPRDPSDPRGFLVALGIALLVALLSMGTLMLVGRPGVLVPP